MNAFVAPKYRREIDRLRSQPSISKILKIQQIRCIIAEGIDSSSEFFSETRVNDQTFYSRVPRSSLANIPGVLLLNFLESVEVSIENVMAFVEIHLCRSW